MAREQKYESSSQVLLGVLIASPSVAAVPPRARGEQGEVVC